MLNNAQNSSVVKVFAEVSHEVEAGNDRGYPPQELLNRRATYSSTQERLTGNVLVPIWRTPMRGEMKGV